MGKVNYTTMQINNLLGSVETDLPNALKKLPVAMQVSRTDDTGATFALKLADGTTLSDTLGIATYDGPGDDDGLAGLMSPWKVKILDEAWSNSKMALIQTYTLRTDVDSLLERIEDCADSEDTDYRLNELNRIHGELAEFTYDLYDDLEIERQERSAGDEACRDYTDESCQTLDHKIDTVQGLLEDDIDELKEGKQDRLLDSEDIVLSTKLADIQPLSSIGGGVDPSDPGVGELQQMPRNAACLTDRAKRYAFDDMFLAAAGSWGTIDYDHHDEDGKHTPYYLNELWLTYEEAKAVMAAGAIVSQNASLRYKGANIRTNLPPAIGTADSGSTLPKFCIHAIARNSQIEVLNLCANGNSICLDGTAPGGSDYIFEAVPELTKIIGVIDVGAFQAAATLKIFGTMIKLQDFQLNKLKQSINLSRIPNISADSLKFMINHKSGTNGIVITLHADAYNKILVAESAGDDADELTKVSEWSGLLELAASKNVTFACA